MAKDPKESTSIEEVLSEEDREYLDDAREENEEKEEDRPDEGD